MAATRDRSEAFVWRLYSCFDLQEQLVGEQEVKYLSVIESVT